jgi:arylsulfatase A-like enzyme
MFQMDHIHLGRHTSEIFADAAIDFIRGHDGPDPFLAYVAFTAPHDPRSMPEAYLDLYDPDQLTLPPNLLPEHPFRFGWRDGRDERLAPYPRTPEIVRRHMADYYAMITHMDEAIGRIVKAVEDRGLLEETLFVITADHGLSLGQHGLFGKQNLYDSSLRIPLIFAGPGVPRGERRDTMVYQMDIFPTLCDSLGLEMPASVTGRSFLPSLVDPEVRHRDRLYFAYRDKMRGVRDERHKLIEYHHEGNRMTQLFDTLDDPWETRNLADDPRYAGKMTDLLAEMTTFRDDWNERDHPLGEEFWSEYERLISPAARE